MKLKQSNFQFTNPVLTELYFKENEEFNEENFEGIDTEFTTRVDKNGDEAKVSLTLQAESEEYPFSLRVKMTSQFRWDEGTMTEDMIEEMLRINAPSLLISYIRTIVATVTSGSKFPTWHIPFIDMRKNEIDE